MSPRLVDLKGTRSVEASGSSLDHFTFSGMTVILNHTSRPQVALLPSRRLLRAMTNEIKKIKKGLKRWMVKGGVGVRGEAGVGVASGEGEGGGEGGEMILGLPTEANPSFPQRKSRSVRRP